MHVPGVKAWQQRKRRKKVSRAVDVTFDSAGAVLEATFWIAEIIVTLHDD